MIVTATLAVRTADALAAERPVRIDAIDFANGGSVLWAVGDGVVAVFR